MSNKLHGKSLILVGFTLFSMFFGAGNLIFPPFLGAEAGSNAWLAFLGFAVSAIGMPVVGVIAVARAGSLETLASRVHPRFALVFTLLIYLSIGPCLAIPRTASTSFQMLSPLIGAGNGHQLLYSAVFFAAAFLVALHPERLTDCLGRVLCPALIALILVLFVSCLVHPVAAHYGTPSADYASLPALTGILGGYQTMDTLAVYAMLTHAGALSGAAFPGGSTGADTLTSLAHGLFGTAGQVLLAAIFIIACFNTCVGLISCVGQYFHGLLPRIPYPAVAAFFALTSMLISNLGLAGIIRLSTPVLNAIYPIAIVLIALSFLPLAAKKRAVWPLAIAFTAAQSICAALPLGPLSAAANALPLASLGFGWLLPACLGLALGMVFPEKRA